MPTTSAPVIDSPAALASEWIILMSGCEDLMSYEEWSDRKDSAVDYADAMGEGERTEFWYSLAGQACTEPLLAPTPGLRMSAEVIAQEMRRLEHIVHDLDDGRSEHAPWNWIRFTDPLFYGFTIGENSRYAHERTNLAYGRGTLSYQPGEYDDVKMADLYPREPRDRA
ncbi:hypothetical protein J2X46_001758 [Nocardioides sp. BE266]|uniref:hypothetical protein n=1 Tax=Nocardioides sp. BE266 TaxID=2817725 RepID=UPI0028627549|nr:hypothetical protein [Nocardioides sp. BE266]MDR7252773.1 hypothetical protein [Nocardioides sp. BE266]